VLTGLLLAILASVIHATADAAKKGLTRRQSPADALTGYILFGLPLAALLWLGAGLPGMPREGFLLYAAASVVPNLLANILFFEAVRVSPLSLTLPFLAFTPAFLIGTSFLINRELPSLLGAAGIVLVLVGALLLHAGELRHGATGPLRAIVRERGSLLMTAVALIWSFTAAADKQAVLRSGPFAYLALWHVGMLAPLVTTAALRRRLGVIVAPRAALATSGAAALHVAGMAVQLAALPLLQAAYVIAIKRAGMVVGIFYGWLLFKEQRVRERLLGAAVMVAGVLCITAG
jgi:drug/metabolite transporter (DMT)-like permease